MTATSAAPTPEIGLEHLRNADRERRGLPLACCDARLWPRACADKNTRLGKRLLERGIAWGRARAKSRKLQEESDAPERKSASDFSVPLRYVDPSGFKWNTNCVGSDCVGGSQNGPPNWGAEFATARDSWNNDPWYTVETQDQPEYIAHVASLVSDAIAAPASDTKLRQEALDALSFLFHFKGNPKYDPNLEERENAMGITDWHTVEDAQVRIGQTAFDTIADLMSTLAHESVHIEQIRSGNKDYSGLNVRSEDFELNEVEAYVREREFAMEHLRNVGYDFGYNEEKIAEYYQKLDFYRHQATQGDFEIRVPKVIYPPECSSLYCLHP